MKQSDINRLEKAAAHYHKIEALLNSAFDSIEKQPTEHFHNGEKTTLQLVREMLASAVTERTWLEGKIKAFREL